jgi:hypothetical protein
MFAPTLARILSQILDLRFGEITVDFIGRDAFIRSKRATAGQRITAISRISEIRDGLAAEYAAGCTVLIDPVPAPIPPNSATEPRTARSLLL